MFRCFSQLPLHEDSQEMYSIITRHGIVKLKRVLMGSCGSVAFFQQAFEQTIGLALFKNVLKWLDKMLGNARSPVELMDVLEELLAGC